MTPEQLMIENIVSVFLIIRFIRLVAGVFFFWILLSQNMCVCKKKKDLKIKILTIVKQAEY